MTSHSPSAIGARLQGWAMIVVLVTGFGLGLAALHSPGPQQRLRDVMTLDAFLAGRTAGAVNNAMAHDLPIGPVLSAIGGVVRWRVFGSGGPQVSVGCHDWLYLMEELRPWPDAAAAMEARANALRRIYAGLTAQGVELVVAIVPDKARIEAATACGVPYSSQSRARLSAFTGLLGGLPVVDLDPVFAAEKRPLYYRTDTHWNQDGAALAARSIATAVKVPLTHDHSYRTAAAPQETDRVGDLLRLMSLENVPDLAVQLRPLPDRQRTETTVETSAPADTGGLLDDAPVPQVALIGSSFSVNANFHGRLQDALQAPVAQFAEAGGAFWGSARDYFRSQAFRETPPKLVVWEIPERVVNQPIGTDEAAFLKDWSGRGALAAVVTRP